jgi:hypothetical protein
MGDPARIDASELVSVEFDEDDVEPALVRLLNELLAQARTHRISLREFPVIRDGARWRCVAAGGPWPVGADRRVEVKGGP